MNGKQPRDGGALSTVIVLFILSWPGLTWAWMQTGTNLLESVVLAIPVGIAFSITFLPAIVVIAIETMWVVVYLSMGFYQVVTTIL